MDIEVVGEATRLTYRAGPTEHEARFGAQVDGDLVLLSYEGRQGGTELRLQAADLEGLRDFLGELFAAEDARRGGVWEPPSTPEPVSSPAGPLPEGAPDDSQLVVLAPPIEESIQVNDAPTDDPEVGEGPADGGAGEAAPSTGA